MSSYFLLLDAARMERDIEKAKKLNLAHCCLYRESEEAPLSPYAPYLFEFIDGSPFATWVNANSRGKSWGVIVYSHASQSELHSHFRRFLIVKNDSGKRLYFRFYDPRVLRTVLPTFHQEQLREFFGPIEEFTAEDKDPHFSLRFRLEKGALITIREPISMQQ